MNESDLIFAIVHSDISFLLKDRAIHLWYTLWIWNRPILPIVQPIVDKDGLKFIWSFERIRLDIEIDSNNNLYWWARDRHLNFAEDGETFDDRLSKWFEKIKEDEKHKE